jgi:signal transduction histidine kinase
LDQDLADRITNQHAQSGIAGMNSVVRVNDRSYIIVDTKLRRGGEEIGDLLCVMDLERWVSRFAANLADGLRMEISENGSVIFVTGTDQRTLEGIATGVQFHLEGFENAFTLVLMPTEGYIARERSPWTQAILIGGIVGSSVLWLILKQALMLVQSRHEIRKQASELSSKSNQLARANAELIAHNREMEHLNRAISHDLHSPLFSIKNYISLLRNNWREGNQELNNEYIGRVSHIADRMSGTIDSLLSVSAVRRTDSRHVRVRLNPLINDVLEYIEGDVQEADAKIEVEDDLHDVIGDPVLLGNIFQNLISNATKYARVPDQQLRIHIGSQLRGEMVCVFVEDNGQGIRHEFREAIFEAFERGESTTVPGTGIGLSIVSRGVRVHGGEAWVENSPLGGARFCVTFPAATSRARAVPEHV